MQYVEQTVSDVKQFLNLSDDADIKVFVRPGRMLARGYTLLTTIDDRGDILYIAGKATPNGSSSNDPELRPLSLTGRLAKAFK